VPWLIDEVASLDNLWDAWHQVRRRGSGAGIDGVTVADFALRAKTELKTLRQELRDGAYLSQPLRGAFVPKARGGWRQIGIPTVRDRVAQRACLNVLEPRLEPHLEECSYAYRTGRSIYGAIAQIEAWRASGQTTVLDADIENCFGSIDREHLLNVLSRYVSEPHLLYLVRGWLETGTDWPSRKDTDKQVPLVVPRGIPQGNIISPLLCNLFLDIFDEELLAHRFALVRYADDFVVLTRSRAQAEDARETAQQSLAGLGLQLHRGQNTHNNFRTGIFLSRHRIRRRSHGPDSTARTCAKRRYS
jgi:group II intron reverse transcriptase/maturase